MLQNVLRNSLLRYIVIYLIRFGPDVKSASRERRPTNRKGAHLAADAQHGHETSARRRYFLRKPQKAM